MKSRQLLFPLVGLVFAGCAAIPYQPYARDVKRKPQVGGTIALKREYRPEDRAKADDLIKSNCGTNTVKVTEEGEVAIGQSTSSTAQEQKTGGIESQQVGTFLGMPVTSSGYGAGKTTNGTATVTNVNEWQINYECVSAATDAAPAQKASSAVTAPATNKKKK